LEIIPPQGHINIHPGPECLSDPIIETGTYRPDQSPKEALRQFFDLICRKCGSSYPNYAPFV
jgi:hypothetical protein